MSLEESPALQTVSSPLKSATVGSDTYVLFLAAHQSYYAAAESAPSNAIHLFDKVTLRRAQTLPGHEVATTHLRSVDNIAGLTRQSMISSGKDGTVKVWDERSNSTSMNLTGSGAPLLCCDASPDGLTLAAGTAFQGEDASILYWDPRNPGTPLRTHASTHSDDITAIHFLNKGIIPAGSSPHNVLLSSSSDGLICTSNADENDEDEAVLHVGNWGCSVAQAGWIYHEHAEPRIWAASDMETFSSWSNELDMSNCLDIRGPSIHTQERTWVTDYLITGHNCHEGNFGFSAFVGSNEGDIALISDPSYPDTLSLHRLWTNGHLGVVRSVYWDLSNNVLVTGGEDSKINAWYSPPLDSKLSELNDQPNDVPMDVDDSPFRKRVWEPEPEPDTARHATSERGHKRTRQI